MTIFRNFKNQLQRFITIFGNVINQGITKILDEVKDQFPETKEFIDEHQEQGYSKENISMEEVIFLFTCLHAKI